MSDLAVRVYTPESSLSHPRIMLRDMFRDLRTSLDPALRLAVRDIRASHRQAFLGILWAFIMPLANTVTWVFLSYAGIVSVGDTELPYAVYVFTGTMLWSIFTDAMGSPMAQTSTAGALLTKLNFPREALLLAGIYKSLFHTTIKASMLIVTLILVGLNPGWGLLLFPLGILSLMLVGTVLGLLITPVGMLYVDVGRVVGFGMQFLMYMSPVVFPMPKEGWAAVLFTINPLSPLILTARDWLTGFAPEYLTYFLAVNAVALALLLVVWTAYRLALPIIVERMSA
jgi:lipopolysaccharide transport system permease protein